MLSLHPFFIWFPFVIVLSIAVVVIRKVTTAVAQRWNKWNISQKESRDVMEMEEGLIVEKEMDENQELLPFTICFYPNMQRQKFEDTARYFEEVCKTVFQSIECADGHVVRVGSFAANIDIENSDLDFSIHSSVLLDRQQRFWENKWKFNGRIAKESDIANGVLENFRKTLRVTGYLRMQNDNEANVRYHTAEIIRGRFPILMIFDSKTKITFDVGFGGDQCESHRNTQFLASADEKHPHFSFLCRAIKRFGKDKGIIDGKTGYLNSFSWCLLVFNFLQINRDLKNKRIEDIFFDLISFYSTFKFEKYAICVAEGKKIEKTDEMFNKNRREPRNDLVMIMDPFKENWNCATTLREKENLENIQRSLKQLLHSMKMKKAVFKFEADLEQLQDNEEEADIQGDGQLMEEEHEEQEHEIGKL